MRQIGNVEVPQQVFLAVLSLTDNDNQPVFNKIYYLSRIMDFYKNC